MSRKKQEVKPQRYIAINEDYDELIHIGSLDQVGEAIVDYCSDNNIDADDIDNTIKIYELGREMAFGVETKLEIYF